jgi:phytoene synthase
MATTYAPTWERTLGALAQEAMQPVLPHPAPVADGPLLARAYAECGAVIAEHGKTFYLASKLLPPAKRRAIRALYAFCRVTDDIVDDAAGSTVDKEVRLAAWRAQAVASLPPPDDPVATAWADTRRHYGIPDRCCEQLIAGVARDLHQHRYETFDDLVTYAYGVASTVGLMSLRIIGPAPGVAEATAIPYVIKLGLALQLTNILRDVGEDARIGRVYLPAAELRAWGLAGVDLAHGPVDARWREFMRFQIARTRALYRAAWPGISLFHRDGRFAVAAACALYSAILDDIAAHDYDVFSRRAHVGTWAKLRRLPGIWWREGRGR